MIGELFGGLLVAFGLYSALPLPQIEWKRSTMRYALGFLPLIGVLVGACEYGWLLLAGKLALSGLLYAAGAVLIPVVITGGIHLDGFADTCDALCSYGDREKRLEILKDPHVGAFAILWIGALLVAQLGLFAQVYETPASAKLLLFGYAAPALWRRHVGARRFCAKTRSCAPVCGQRGQKARQPRHARVGAGAGGAGDLCWAHGHRRAGSCRVRPCFMCSTCACAAKISAASRVICAACALPCVRR